MTHHRLRSLRIIRRRSSLTCLAAALTVCSAALASGQIPDRPPATVLTLGDAARLAATQSAAATGARFRADQFAARAGEMRADLLPQVTGSLADGRRTFNTASFGLPLPGFDPSGQVIGPVRTVDVRGRVSSRIVDPAAWGRFRTAQATARSADADAAAAADQAATFAAVAYLRAIRADAQVAARSADSSLAGELLAIARSQLRAGVGVRLDVTRAEARLAGVRAQLISSRNERDRARLDLLRTLGLPLTVPVVLSDSLSALATDDDTVSVETALGEARRSRSDLRAAVTAVQAAHRAMSAARSERLPSLAVFGDDGATSNSYTRLLNTYTYGVQLVVPVFEGFRIAAHVQEQTAVLRQAETRARDVEAQIEADVRGSLLDLASAREQVEASRDRLHLAEQELAQARERFRAGVSGNGDVIAAQLDLDAGRSQHVDALTALQSARVSLAHAEGLVTSLR